MMMDTDNYKNEIDEIHKKIQSLKSLSIDNFKEDLYVDVCDEQKNWSLAKIIERKGDIITVHYDGWSEKFDEVNK